MKKENTLLAGKMSRRELLALGTTLTVPYLLAACGGTANSSNTAHASTAGNALTPSPTERPTPTAADWQALAKSIHGPLVRQGDSEYTSGYQLFNTRFDNIQPTALAYCTSTGDVQACLDFVRRYSVSFALRSGGHSYAGYSTTTGLVIDVTRINAITVDIHNAQTTIGAGAQLIDVYATLAQYGLALPSGSCPTVGITGITLGGGIGVLSRKFGLTCDNLLAAQVVVADGRVLTCDASQNTDLFWALRGGGGGNFGVVTSLTFQAHPVNRLAVFTLNWSWDQAVKMVDAWQNWAPQVPDELWSNCLLLATTTKQASPIARVNGVYVGNVASLNPLVQQLINKIGVDPISSYISNAGLLNTMLAEAGCYGKSIAECHLPSQNPEGQLERDTYGARSDYISQALPSQGISVLVNEITSRQSSSTLGKGGILLDASGGAINRVAADATAFVHRNDLFLIQYIANWNPGDSNSIIAANNSWLAETWQGMRPYVSGAAYQNYIDPDLTDWSKAYYDTNLPRLSKIKAAYDPNNLFHFKQSVAPTIGG
jgi:FAD/FMN-containing dehydrogenase